MLGSARRCQGAAVQGDGVVAAGGERDRAGCAAVAASVVPGRVAATAGDVRHRNGAVGGVDGDHSAAAAGGGVAVGAGGDEIAGEIDRAGARDVDVDGAGDGATVDRRGGGDALGGGQIEAAGAGVEGDQSAVGDDAVVQVNRGRIQRHAACGGEHAAHLGGPRATRRLIHARGAEGGAQGDVVRGVDRHGTQRRAAAHNARKDNVARASGERQRLGASRGTIQRAVKYDVTSARAGSNRQARQQLRRVIDRNASASALCARCRTGSCTTRGVDVPAQVNPRGPRQRDGTTGTADPRRRVRAFRSATYGADRARGQHSTRVQRHASRRQTNAIQCPRPAIGGDAARRQGTRGRDAYRAARSVRSTRRGDGKPARIKHARRGHRQGRGRQVGIHIHRARTVDRHGTQLGTSAYRSVEVNVARAGRQSQNLSACNSPIYGVVEYNVIVISAICIDRNIRTKYGCAIEQCSLAARTVIDVDGSGI